MRKLLILILSLQITSSVYANPEVVAPAPSWQEEAWENFKTPVTTPAINVLWVGTTATVGLVLLRDQVVEPFQVEVSTDRPLGRLSPVGDYSGTGLPNAIYFGAMLGDYYLSDDESSYLHAMNMLQVTLYSTGVTAVLKGVFRQPRPNDPETLTSFPSGHTTAGFAFSSYVACNHSYVAGTAAYALATLVGFSRINDNAHYLHDVVAGATIGTAFGLGICYRNQVQGEQEIMPAQEGSAAYYVLPETDGFSGGVYLSF